ncbi:MAG: universal stress protein [Candidatus Gastranaerophilales bacterium]|nr:universal stress protein [Candidatus Gastranaerophilales bacterium]
MKILFCTDGSDISLNAFYNASIYIKDAVLDPICVIDWSFLPSSMNIDSENYSKAYENIADSVLNFAEKIIQDNGLTCGMKIKTFGSPVEGILEQMERESYDLILLGSHGKKGIQKWLGSVSRQVISNSQVPVFVSKKRTEGKKILFAVDGSEASIGAIKHTAKLFNLQNKEIFVISVKENPELLPMEATLDRNWLDSIEKQQKIHATKAINKAKAILEEEQLQVHNEAILTGSPAQKIIDFAEKEKIDLIIMGARTKIDLSKLLLGSVSKRVVENVTADVLVINK